MNKNVVFNIEEIKKMKDAARYKISIKVPIEYGWIEDMYFVIEKVKQLQIGVFLQFWNMLL